MDLINKNIEIISNIKKKISIIEENSSSSDDENKDIIEIKNTIENIDKKTENLVKLNPFMDRMKKVSEQAKSGEKSNRFIEELDTEELIRVYRENGCSIPKNVFEHYKLKYGITYNGLRNRLINAGVWKFR